ncbi:hypothetical protein D3C77_587740 [compost metagenome]
MKSFFDAADAPLAAAVQHLATVIQERLEAGLQAHHARRARGVQHVHIDGETRLEIGQPEQAFHKNFRLYRPGLRLQDQADILGRLIADVAQQRRLLVLDQVGQLFDQLGLLHLIRHLGDDDAPDAAT